MSLKQNFNPVQLLCDTSLFDEQQKAAEQFCNGDHSFETILTVIGGNEYSAAYLFLTKDYLLDPPELSAENLELAAQLKAKAGEALSRDRLKLSENLPENISIERNPASINVTTFIVRGVEQREMAL